MFVCISEKVKKNEHNGCTVLKSPTHPNHESTDSAHYAAPSHSISSQSWVFDAGFNDWQTVNYKNRKMKLAGITQEEVSNSVEEQKSDWSQITQKSNHCSTDTELPGGDGRKLPPALHT